MVVLPSQTSKNIRLTYNAERNKCGEYLQPEKNAKTKIWSHAESMEFGGRVVFMEKKPVFKIKRIC